LPPATLRDIRLSLKRFIGIGTRVFTGFSKPGTPKVTESQRITLIFKDYPEIQGSP
jgi:hypothetical protein